MATKGLYARIQAAAGELAETNREKYGWSFELPGLKKQVTELIMRLRSAMYPGIFCEKACSGENLAVVCERNLRLSARLLSKMLRAVIPGVGGTKVYKITRDFIASLEKIQSRLETDIEAAYKGDPAATSQREIMLAYPAFEAISIYRLAHRLSELNVPLLPRMMTQYAHRITGIDIHPGAKIGDYFFIDHGTGVVIGETCTIGDHVKLYQGVTLGAKSFPLDDGGNPVKGIKRHPDIGSNVIIYAGATVLGGDTVIEDGCVIGGNVWLTHSVGAGEKIFYGNGGN